MRTFVPYLTERERDKNKKEREREEGGGYREAA